MKGKNIKETIMYLIRFIGPIMFPNHSCSKQFCTAGWDTNLRALADLIKSKQVLLFSTSTRLISNRGIARELDSLHCVNRRQANFSNLLALSILNWSSSLSQSKSAYARSTATPNNAPARGSYMRISFV